MEPQRKKAITDYDGYITGPQLGMWMATSGVNLDFMKDGFCPEFEIYLINCKTYNYLYDLSISYPKLVQMYWDDKSESVEFIWDPELSEVIENSLDTIQEGFFPDFGEGEEGEWGKGV